MNFPNATLIKEEVLLSSKTVERMYPKFSPDGKEVAFIEDRIRLKVLNLETNKVRQITDGSTWYELSGGFNYAWSPDGKWFTLEFIGNIDVMRLTRYARAGSRESRYDGKRQKPDN